VSAAKKQRKRKVKLKQEEVYDQHKAENAENTAEHTI